MSNYNNEQLSHKTLKEVKAIYVAYNFFIWMMEKRQNYKCSTKSYNAYNAIKHNRQMIESLFTREMKRIRLKSGELHEYINVSHHENRILCSLGPNSSLLSDSEKMLMYISFDLFPFVNTNLDESFKIRISNHFDYLWLDVSFDVHPSWWASYIYTTEMDGGITDNPTIFVTNISERIELDSQNLEGEFDKFESYDVRLQQLMSKKIRDAIGIGKYSS